MDDPIQPQLPFYANHTLPAGQRRLVEQHLAGCAACRTELAAWQRLAQQTPELFGGLLPEPVHLLPQSPQQAALTLSQPALQPAPDALPPLSPLLRLHLRRRPGLRQALASAAALIAAQRVILRQALLLPALAAAILLAVFSALQLPRAAGVLAALPFVAIVPIAAVIVATYICTFDQPKTVELIAAAPTSPASLLWARLTLLLGVVAALAFAGSLVVALLDGGRLFQLVAAWLGPMLWLSAFSTLLSLLWRPVAASGLALIGWGGLLLWLSQSSGGLVERAAYLRLLLAPGWLLLALQLLLAALLWLACWRLLEQGSPAALRPEER